MHIRPLNKRTAAPSAISGLTRNTLISYRDYLGTARHTANLAKLVFLVLPRHMLSPSYKRYSLRAHPVLPLQLFPLLSPGRTHCYSSCLWDDQSPTHICNFSLSGSHFSRISHTAWHSASLKSNLQCPPKPTTSNIIPILMSDPKLMGVFPMSSWTLQCFRVCFYFFSQAPRCYTFSYGPFHLALVLAFRRGSWTK